jgi:geranylgeranyl pyrophosphate synthase
MKENKEKAELKGEEALEKVKKIIEIEGAEGWNLVREILLKQKARSPQLKEAIDYALQKPDYFRPAIVSLCSKAVGGSSELTTPYGASLVMLAKAIGIHDDIIDKLKKRDKRFTLFGKFGKEIALIISDILLFKGFTFMRKNYEIGVSQQKTARIFDTIEKFWFEQSESEILELRSRRHVDVTPQECLAKIEMRASELEATTRIGGILGDGSEEEVEALGRYGRFLGTASILRDELIDILEPNVLRHRIRNESLPLPLIYAMQQLKVRSKITSQISKKRFTKKDLVIISKFSDEAGGIDKVAENINELVQKACACIDLIVGENNELKLLTTSLLIRPIEWKSMLQSM